MTNDHIEGQLLATQAAIRALIKSGENPAALKRAVIAEWEEITAAALPRAFSEDFLKGLADARARCLPAGSRAHRG